MVAPALRTAQVMFPAPSAQPQRRRAWPVALIGQFLFVFSIVALSGPGRLDIDDGRTRFEVAQSLVDHGDPVIRDPDAWFTVLPGRYGLNYSNCRLPHSAVVCCCGKQSFAVNKEPGIARLPGRLLEKAPAG